MTRRWRVLRVAAAIAAVAAVAVGFSLPPAAVETAPAAWPANGTTARGAYHIHSLRSDGSGTLDGIAAAAARAGLQFVIVTDHGDGTRIPDPPSYRSGVLTIDAVEINTRGGHYVALGLPAAPYPLAGTPEDVVEDVRRMGGFGIAAHPGSPRPSLQWTAWDAGFDGIEWLNADSEWRDEVWDSLGWTLMTYFFRSPETLASLLDRPDEVLAQWDALGAHRAVPALAGTDAHARIGVRQPTDPDAASVHVPLPGYEASFRAFSNHVVIERSLGGNAGQDANTLLRAIAKGHVFTVIDGLATPGAFEFVGVSGTATAGAGDPLALDGAATLRARIAAPPNTTLALLRNGARVRSTEASSLEADVTGQPGVYRVEAYIAGGPGTPPVPWLVSNPIYVGLERTAPAPSVAAPPSRIAQADLAHALPELGRGCTSVLRPSVEGGVASLSWRYALAPGTPAGQFAAVQIPVAGGLAAFDRVRLRVTSERPVRLWVQLRAPVGLVERWGRTVFADGETREIELPLETFVPIGVTSSARPPLDRVDALLIVADTLNTLPGTGGQITIAGVALVR